MAAMKSVLIIEGVRENGSKFRPSDWPERISSAIAGFGNDQRLRYSPSVRPRMVNGIKCLAVETALEQQNPSMYHHVLNFARENQLRVREQLEDIE
jgi:hypothetical protein